MPITRQGKRMKFDSFTGSLLLAKTSTQPCGVLLPCKWASCATGVNHASVQQTFHECWQPNQRMVIVQKPRNCRTQNCSMQCGLILQVKELSRREHTLGSVCAANLIAPAAWVWQSPCFVLCVSMMKKWSYFANLHNMRVCCTNSNAATCTILLMRCGHADMYVLSVATGLPKLHCMHSLHAACIIAIQQLSNMLRYRTQI